MARLMSDAEIRRRKKLQGHISQTTGALGLASLGAFAASKAPGAKVLTKTPRLARVANKINPEKAKTASLGLSTTGAGIGGAGSFNFASYTNAESRKRKQAMPVTKRGLDVGYYGEIGKAKEWKPSASKFDAERSRMKRSQAYEAGGGAATGGLTAAAGVKGAQAGKLLLRNRKTNPRALNLPSVRAGQAARKAAAVGHGKVGAALAGGAALTGGATLAVRNRNNSRSWASYGKRSAFGVEHDPVSKAINIKPENKGKFTRAAHKAGEGVQEHAHAVVNSSKSSELQRKRAQFAINAKKWHH
jgi:hypothetical protein